MTRDEATKELIRFMEKLVREASTKEELALSGIVALVVAAVKTETTIELMHSLMPFALYLKSRGAKEDAEGISEIAPGIGMMIEMERVERPRVKEEPVEWPDEIDEKVG